MSWTSARRETATIRGSASSPPATQGTRVAVTPIEVDNDESSGGFVVVKEEVALIASCHCNIVGIQHYTGIAHIAHEGEFVRFVREPHNPYDRNAVRVDTMRGETIGHIKHDQAKLLVPYLDDGDLFGLQLEGRIPHPGDGFKLPCSVDFYAVAPLDKLESRSQFWVQRLQTAFRRRFCFKSRLLMSAPVTTAVATVSPAQSPYYGRDVPVPVPYLDEQTYSGTVVLTVSMIDRKREKK